MTTNFEELRQMARDHLWPHAQQVAAFDKPDGLHVIADGKGIWVTDVQGREYIDVLSGMWLANIGYGRPEVADAVYEQMQHITYAPENTTTEPTIRLADRVANLAPDKESRVFLSSGGSEAVETALKMARQYHKLRGNGGKYKVISRRGSYHGATMAAASLGQGGYVEKSFGPMLPGNVHITQPYEYRCVYCSNQSECSLECANDVDRAIQHEGPDTVAAFIGEPVSSSQVQIPHADYWPTIRKICDDNDVLLIFDESVTGFRLALGGAQEYYGLKPDLAAYAKVIGGGVALSAVAGRAEIIELADPAAETTPEYAHVKGTMHGSPIGSATGMATLDILSEPGFYDRLHADAEAFGAECQAVLDRHGLPAIVTGKASLWQILFADRDPVNHGDIIESDRASSRALDLALLKNGIYVLPNVRRFVSAAHGQEDFEETLKALDAACRAVS